MTISIPPPKIKRFLLFAGILFTTLLAAVYLNIPFGVGYWASTSAASQVGEPPEDFEEVSFETNDTVRIQTWFYPPENGAVIILVHGASSSRESIRDHAKFLSEAGFGVLAIDMRGHGESGGHCP